MADLQTEIFRKVLPKMQQLNNLTFDDDVGTTTEVKVTTEDTKISQTELLWQYIKDNPGSTAPGMFKARVIDDYKNIATRVNQLAKRGLLRQDINSHPMKNYVVDETYPRVTLEDRLQRMQNARGTKPKKIKKVKRVVQPVVETPKTPVNILDTMSVMQARELYDQLKKIFGG